MTLAALYAVCVLTAFTPPCFLQATCKATIKVDPTGIYRYMYYIAHAGVIIAP
jgi:hypothetical protein